MGKIRYPATEAQCCETDANAQRLHIRQSKVILSDHNMHVHSRLRHRGKISEACKFCQDNLIRLIRIFKRTVGYMQFLCIMPNVPYALSIIFAGCDLEMLVDTEVPCNNRQQKCFDGIEACCNRSSCLLNQKMNCSQ